MINCEILPETEPLGNPKGKSRWISQGSRLYFTWNDFQAPNFTYGIFDPWSCTGTLWVGDKVCINTSLHSPHICDIQATQYPLYCCRAAIRAYTLIPTRRKEKNSFDILVRGSENNVKNQESRDALSVIFSSCHSSWDINRLPVLMTYYNAPDLRMSYKYYEMHSCVQYWILVVSLMH